jgi:Ca-activated chloride channel family protein
MSAVSAGALWPLWLLALLPLMWWAAMRSRSSLARRHLALAATLRTFALAFIVLALLQPVWTTPATGVSVVYVLDVSRSVASNFVQSALQFVQRANTQAKPEAVGYVVFAERARPVARAEDVAQVAVSDAPGADRTRLLYQGATDLERALDQALLGLDPDRVKRVVLFTDGNQTHGDVWRALPHLQAQGVRVFAFPATPQTRADAWIEALELPDALRRDEPVNVTVRVFSQQRTPARVRLSAAGEALAGRDVTLDPGDNSVVLPVRLRRAGMVTLLAQVQAQGDTLHDNNRLEQSVWVGPRPRVLYVEGQPQSARYLRQALVQQGLDVTTAAPAEIPASSGGLDAFDAVIVSDVSPKAVDTARMQALRDYVRERGGGLIFAAGESTYGEAGFSGTPLEAVLPVEFKSEEKRKDLALVLCIDRSYSMKGLPIKLAKAGARAALDLLEEQHYFGVVAFDSQPHEAVPLQYVRSKRRAEDLIDRIQASGQTNIYPALATAWRMLQNHPAKRKHVIVLSDGDTAPADYDRLLKRIQEAKITVSTVTIGRTGNPELMARIASLGGGKAYVAEELEQVPQLFVEDTRSVTQTALMEEPFRPVAKRRIEALRGLDFALAPPLLGFASTKAKEGAEVFLATSAQAPILVRWQYGLGRAVLFASDVKNRWAAEWLHWDGYGKFWAQLTRDTMRRDTAEQVVFGVTREGDQAKVALRLMTDGGAWRNGLLPQVRVRGPDGGTQLLALRQRGPGEYAAHLPVETAGSRPYTFEVLGAGGVSAGSARRAGTRQLFYPYPDEYRSFPPDLELLEALATQTGGKVGASVGEIFAAQADRGVSRTALWPWLAALGLLLYLCDIAVRRAPWVRRWLDT